MNELIQSYSISFHNDNSDFGVLSFTLTNKPLTPINKRHIHFVFNIDHSGSMDDECKDGRTKMRHIIYTLENIIKVCHEKASDKQNNICVSIYMQLFDEVVTPIITDMNSITDYKVDQLIKIIRKITPRGSTNIGEALDVSRDHIEEYAKTNANTNCEIVHILLTDGEVTSGAFDKHVLKAKLPNLAKCSHIFIGYGKTHDSNLLSYLASVKQGQYCIVDILENAGLVYGEIIHGILYKVLDNVTLTIINNNTLIYNYLTNEWTRQLILDPLSSEQRKDFQIKCIDKSECNIVLQGNNGVNLYTYTFATNKTNIVIEDLTKYIFRQKTQELLYKSREMEQHTASSKNNDDFDFATPVKRRGKRGIERKDDIPLKSDLKLLHKEILNYIKNTNTKDIKFLTNLADDIYICYKTIGTNYGSMFTYARQTSQGKQQTYTCSSIHELEIIENTNTFNDETFNDDNLQIQVSPFKSIAHRPIFTPINNNNNKKNKTPISFIVESDATEIIDVNDYDYDYDYKEDLENQEDQNQNQDQDIDTYQLSNTILSPYKTAGILDMMTQMSQMD